MFLLLLACQDYRLSHNDKNDGTNTLTTLQGDSGGGPLPFPCEEAGVMTLQVQVDETCAAEHQTGTLDTVVEWSIDSFADYPDYSEVLTTPMVGNMTDDNGDGLINEDDMPDIVMMGDDDTPPYNHGAIHIISGDGDQSFPAIFMGVYQDFQVYPYRYASVALGDIDNDHEPDIVTIAEVIAGPVTDDTGGGGSDDTQPPESGGGGDTGKPPDTGPKEVPVSRSYASGNGPMCLITAFKPDGTVKWLATEAPIPCAGHVPAIADLEGDGPVEVIVGPIILEGADGALRSAGQDGTGRYPAFTEVGYISVPEDLDGDAIQEVIAGNTLYAPDGTVICEASAYTDGFPAVADLDGDGEGEVVLVGNGRMMIYRDDCTPITAWDLEGIGNGGPPTIADFDADGQPEIGVATDTAYAVYESDGTIKWSVPVTDASSYTTGSSVFDFDGDGQAEVVYGDENTLWILDGATGAVRLADTFHTSRTLHEYPTIVDVDGDGMAEIVVPQGGGHHGVENRGVYVLGSKNNDWQYARPVWNQHAYYINNIADDLSIPSPPSDNWPDHNNFRSGDVNPVSAGLTVDVTPMAVVCDESCKDGMIGVVVRLGNQGTLDMRKDVPVSIYSEINGSLYLLQTQRTQHTVAPGRVSEAIGFTIDPLDVPDHVLVVMADDEGGYGELAECHEDNNLLRLEKVECD